MSEADCLRALIFDLEDELTCLWADQEMAERDGDDAEIAKLENEYERVLYELDAVHEDLVEWGRTNG